MPTRQKVAVESEGEGIVHLSESFDDPARELEISEDVIGLGRYGRTLTVLHTSQLPDEEEQVNTDHFNPDGKWYRW